MASSLVICLINCMLISQLSAIPIDNGVEGDPEIECGPNTITVNFNTRNNFEGHVFVKGRYAEGGCKSDQTGKKIASLSLPFATCGIERQRSLNPKGIFIGVSVVITFHPQFLTKVDRAYSVQCFYMEADKTVSQELEVSEITTAFQTQVVPMPVCRYDVLDGGPNGEPIKFALIGQQVYHKWTCETESIDIFCMVVHSCFVDDGQSSRIQLLDDAGCALDKYALNNLEYISDLMAGKEAHVFKFADRAALQFQCQVSIAVKEPDQQCPRPQCQEPAGLGGGASGSGVSSGGSAAVVAPKPATEKPLSARTPSGAGSRGPPSQSRSSPSAVPPPGAITGRPPSAQPTPPGIAALPVIAAAGRSLPAAASLLPLSRSTTRTSSTSTRFGRPSTGSTLSSTRTSTTRTHSSTSSSSSTRQSTSTTRLSTPSTSTGRPSSTVTSTQSSSTLGSTSTSFESTQLSSIRSTSIPDPSVIDQRNNANTNSNPTRTNLGIGVLQNGNNQSGNGTRFDFESTFPFRLRRVRSLVDVDFAGTWDVRAPLISTYENFDNDLEALEFAMYKRSQSQSAFKSSENTNHLYCVPTVLIGFMVSVTLLSLLASIVVALFLCLRRRSDKYYVD